MTVSLVLFAVIVLTVLTLVVSRLGAREHQEELNGHGEPVQPKADRPADASAEAMNVDAPGEPGSAALHESVIKRRPEPTD